VRARSRYLEAGISHRKRLWLRAIGLLGGSGAVNNCLAVVLRFYREARGGVRDEQSRGRCGGSNGSAGLISRIVVVEQVCKSFTASSALFEGRRVLARRRSLARQLLHWFGLVLGACTS
jgi:hypothetical protein